CLPDMATAAGASLFGCSCDVLDIGRRGESRSGEDLLDPAIRRTERSSKVRSNRKVFGLTLIDIYARGADRIMKQQLTEVALCLGSLVAIRHAAIRTPRHGNGIIRSRNFQLG